MLRDFDRYPERFARAIAGRTGAIRLIQADNNSVSARWDMLNGGDAFAVYLTGPDRRFKTIALDFDVKLADAATAEFEAEQVAALFRHAGLPAVLTASGPAGGRHVLLTLNDRPLHAGEARRLVAGLQRLGLRAFDATPMLNSASGAIRPPLAPHRNGGHSVVLGDQVEALASLESGASHAGVMALIDCLPAERKLRPLTAAPQTSAHVDDNRVYPSGSEEFQAYATKMANRGLTESQFLEGVRAMPPNHPVKRAMSRHDRDWKPYAKRSYRAALKFVREKPVSSAPGADDDQVIADWKARMPTIRLPQHQRRVAAALLLLADQHGRCLVGISARDCGDLASVGKSTAAKALRELVDIGMLELASQGTSRTAQRFRLEPVAHWQLPQGQTPHPTVPQLDLGGCAAALELAENTHHDLWRLGRGLSESVRETYVALARRETTPVKELAVDVGRTPSQVRRHLNKLNTVGMARRRGNGFWDVEVPDPEVAARILGTAGAAAAQRAGHHREQVADRIRVVAARFDDKQDAKRLLNVDRWTGEIAA